MPLITQSSKKNKALGSFAPNLRSGKLKGESFLPDFVAACSRGDVYAEAEFLRVIQLFNEG